MPRYLTDNGEAIWEDLQDGTVKLVYSPEYGTFSKEDDVRPLDKAYVDRVWGPLEVCTSK